MLVTNRLVKGGFSLVDVNRVEDELMREINNVYHPKGKAGGAAGGDVDVTGLEGMDIR
jgi:hypothetical protein